MILGMKGGDEMCKNYKNEYEAMCWETKRYQKKYDLVYQWMKLKQNHIELIEFFQERNISSLAVYGIGDLGRLICKEPGINEIIKYGIDRRGEIELEGLSIYTLESIKHDVDAILITPVLITDEIEDRIYDVLGEQNTFVLEEVLFELSRKYGIESELWPI